MGFFKRKKSKVRFCTPWVGGEDIMTEQEYVDRKFDSMERKIEDLEELIEINGTMNKIEHIFILPNIGFQEKDGNNYMSPEESREWAEKKGYSYVRSFERRGELWVKREKK